MNLIVDSSVAFKWLVDEDGSDAAMQLLRNHNVIAPDLLLIECRNAILTGVRRGRLSVEQAHLAERQLEVLEIDIVTSRPFLRPAFALALELSHPVYDCVYLAAARATDRRLVTADRKFAARIVSHPSREIVDFLGAAAP